MIANLLGSLLGFGTAFLPKVMDYFQDKQDKAHELKLLAAQAEIQLKLEGVRLDATYVDADIRQFESVQENQNVAIRNGSRWLANLSGSIRPIVTYLFVFEFLIINTSIAILLLRQEGVSIETLRMILDEDFMVMLSTMLSFWYGNRTFGNRKT